MSLAKSDNAKLRARLQARARRVSHDLDVAGARANRKPPPLESAATSGPPFTPENPDGSSGARMAGSQSGVPAAWGTFYDGSTPLGREARLAARGLRKVYTTATSEARAALEDAARWRALKILCMRNLAAGVRGVTARRAQSYARS
jgi:hypothetical protein